MILTSKKNSKAKWTKKELEVLSIYAILGYVVRYIIVLIAMYCAVTRLNARGCYSAQWILEAILATIVIFFCLCPLLNIVANHNPEGRVARLRSNAIESIGRMGDAVDVMSFSSFVFATIVTIIAWLIVMICLTNCEGWPPLFGFYSKTMFEYVALIVSIGDLIVQSLYAYSAFYGCASLIAVPAEFAAPEEKTDGQNQNQDQVKAQ